MQNKRTAPTKTLSKDFLHDTDFTFQMIQFVILHQTVILNPCGSTSESTTKNNTLKI